MSQISEAIEKIKLFCPPALQPGLTAQKIEFQLNDFLLKPPQEVYEFYQLSNGLCEDGTFTSLFRVLSLSSAIRSYKYYCRTDPEYNRIWLPIVSAEDHLFVTSCLTERNETCELLDLGDDLNVVVRHVGSSEPHIEFHSLTEVIVEIADGFEREFNNCGKCWIGGNSFYP